MNSWVWKFWMLTNEMKFICYVDISQKWTNNNEKHKSVQHIKINVKAGINRTLPG